MRRKVDERAELCREYHDVLMPALRYVAYRCGYALGVHGSVARDIDVIAAPWRDGPISAEALIEEITKAIEAILGCARTRSVDKGRLPEKKPCGRLGWSIYLTYDDNGPYLDISVMPVGDKREEAQRMKAKT